MYVIERFGNISLSIFRNTFTLSPVPGQSSVVQTTSGAFDNDGLARNRQVFPLPLSYSCTVFEDTLNANRTILDTLRAAVGTRALLYRRARNDNVLHTCIARLRAEPHEWPWTQKGWFEIQLNFEQMSPWIGTSQGTGWVFDSGVLFDSGRSFDEGTGTFGLVTSPRSATVTNGGNLPATSIVMTVKAGSADITALTIRNTLTGCYLVWTGTLTAFSTLRIDTGAWSVTNNGVDNYNGLDITSPFHINEHWMEMAPGSNSMIIEWVGGGTGSSINFLFNDVWA